MRTVSVYRVRENGWRARGTGNGEAGRIVRVKGSKIQNSKFKIQNSSLPLSVYMITFNNGATVARALESVKGWAGEIVVVDSHSTDGSLEVMDRYADRVVQFDTLDFRKKYQYAQDQCRLSWALFIDADEWLTEEIKGEIAGVLKADTGYDGFVVARRNIYLGREIKHGGWYPDEEIRLYRREKGSWQGGLHAKIHVKGNVGRLRNYYMHRPYADTSHQIMTVDRYTSAFAKDLLGGRKRNCLFNMITRPIYRFFRDYIFKLGFLDGIPGLIIVASTMYYVFMKYAKLWEMEQLDPITPGEENDSADT
jgi:glycosyltransferase involved in cell wall biosynthesis